MNVALGQVWEGTGKHNGIRMKVVQVTEHRVKIKAAGPVRHAYRDKTLSVPVEKFVCTNKLVA